MNFHLPGDLKPCQHQIDHPAVALDAVLLSLYLELGVVYRGGFFGDFTLILRPMRRILGQIGIQLVAVGFAQFPIKGFIARVELILAI